jgi:hypothetical protein
VSQVDLGAIAFLSLVALSALSTLAALAVFHRFTNRQAVARAKNLIVAHLLECALFLDEPALVFRAQRELLRENLRLLRLLVVPCAILILPFWIFFVELEANFGHAPLVVGAPAVVTLQLNGESESPQLIVPDGIAVETPAIRNVFEQQVNWRIRPFRVASGQVRITLPGRVLTTNVRAGRRMLTTAVSPFKKPAIDLHYPSATILHHPWLTWYIAASILTALLWWARYT